jgi:hypothetical protein
MRNRAGITIPPSRRSCNPSVRVCDESDPPFFRDGSKRRRETLRRSYLTSKAIDSIVPRSLVRDEKFIASRGIPAACRPHSLAMTPARENAGGRGRGRGEGELHRSSSLASSRGVDAVDTDQRSTSPSSLDPPVFHVGDRDTEARTSVFRRRNAAAVGSSSLLPSFSNLRRPETCGAKLVAEGWPAGLRGLKDSGRRGDRTSSPLRVGTALSCAHTHTHARARAHF